LAIISRAISTRLFFFIFFIARLLFEQWLMVGGDVCPVSA